MSGLQLDQVHLVHFDTELGECALAGSGWGLLACALPGRPRDHLRGWLDKHLPGVAIDESAGPLADGVRAVQEFLAGRVRELPSSLDLRGTPFQQDVWRALRTIPYGETITYAELSRRAGHDGAWRAVGAANGANPLPLFVPCHRVVASDGIGGFTGGLDLKRRLLALEQGQLELGFGDA